MVRITEKMHVRTGIEEREYISKKVSVGQRESRRESGISIAEPASQRANDASGRKERRSFTKIYQAWQSA